MHAAQWWSGCCRCDSLAAALTADLRVDGRDFKDLRLSSLAEMKDEARKKKAGKVERKDLKCVVVVVMRGVEAGKVTVPCFMLL